MNHVIFGHDCDAALNLSEHSQRRRDKGADRALRLRIHSQRFSNHLDDTHATLSVTALQLCFGRSKTRAVSVTLTHTLCTATRAVELVEEGRGAVLADVTCLR